MYFNLGSDIIRENCNFEYCFHKTDINPRVHDGRNKIILANWPDNKHIVCNENNDISVKIPSYFYVLVNRSVLCNCGIEVGNNFLLESLDTCHDAESKLDMYFMVNIAFINYLYNLTDSLRFPVLLNSTTHEQILPISLQSFELNSDLLKTLKMLKDFVHQFWHKRKFLICKKGIIIIMVWIWLTKFSFLIIIL